MRFISLDIDGIVNNYPVSMYNHAFNELGLVVKSKNELIEKLSLNKVDYSDFKHDYRKKYECIEKTNYDAEITQEFFDFYKEIEKFEDIDIIFRTTRPESIYPGTLFRTQKWLNYNGIHNLVTQKNKKTFELNDPILHLDDEIESLDLHKTFTSVDRLFLFKQTKDNETAPIEYNVISNLMDICPIIRKM